MDRSPIRYPIRVGHVKPGLNRPRRTEPTSVEKLGEDPWGGVKVLSNLEIARSLRNGFRASLGQLPCGGRATEFGRGAPRLPAETQLRIPQRITPGVRAWG